MENILSIHLQEIVFSSSVTKLSRQLSKLEKSGKLRKIAARIYSPNFNDGPETIVRRNLFAILGKLYPGSMLSHRSALEFKPTSAGHIFLTYTYTKKINLPGITLRFMEGHGPIAGDNPFSGELYTSQLERALLENMQVFFHKSYAPTAMHSQKKVSVLYSYKTLHPFWPDIKKCILFLISAVVNL